MGGFHSYWEVKLPGGIYIYILYNISRFTVDMVYTYIYICILGYVYIIYSIIFITYIYIYTYIIMDIYYIYYIYIHTHDIPLYLAIVLGASSSTAPFC